MKLGLQAPHFSHISSSLYWHWLHLCKFFLQSGANKEIQFLHYLLSGT